MSCSPRAHPSLPQVECWRLLSAAVDRCSDDLVLQLFERRMAAALNVSRERTEDDEIEEDALRFLDAIVAAQSKRKVSHHLARTAHPRVTVRLFGRLPTSS
jgi:hypothetical protein